MKLIDTYGLGLEPPLTAVFLIPLTILLALERTVAIYLHVNQQLCDAGVLIYEHWFLNGPFPASFLFIFVFSTQLIVNFADD